MNQWICNNYVRKYFITVLTEKWCHCIYLWQECQEWHLHMQSAIGRESTGDLGLMVGNGRVKASHDLPFWATWSGWEEMNYGLDHTPIQCVPIKRKPVLSVRYLLCHARLKQTIYFIIKSIFSSFIDTKHIMISQCMNEREQFKLKHVKNDLRRIMV